MSAGKTTPRETVWFMAKPGEERRFVQTREPSSERAKALHKEGYRIFRINFRLPPDWDSADFQIQQDVKVEEVDAPSDS